MAVLSSPPNFSVCLQSTRSFAEPDGGPASTSHSGSYALDRHLQLPNGRAYRWSVDDEDWEEESVDEGQQGQQQQQLPSTSLRERPQEPGVNLVSHGSFMSADDNR